MDTIQAELEPASKPRRAESMAKRSDRETCELSHESHLLFSALLRSAATQQQGSSAATKSINFLRRSALTWRLVMQRSGSRSLALNCGIKAGRRGVRFGLSGRANAQPDASHTARSLPAAQLLRGISQVRKS